MQQRYRAPMQPRMSPRYFGPMQGRPSFGPPMMGRPPQMRQGGGGGLLSKILGKGNQRNGGQGMGGARLFGAPQTVSNSGGFLKSLTNPNAISGFLSNTQKMLNTAQQIGPMVNQYGPLIKNLPTMWRLYRGLKNAPDVTEEEDNNTESKELLSSEKKHSSQKSQPVQEKVSKQKPSKKADTSGTKPKLYI